MRGKFRGVATSAIIIAGLSQGAIAAQAREEPKVLEPSSKWVVNYADDSCRLMRTFGEGEDQSILIMDRFEPGDGFTLVVAGKPFKGFEGTRQRTTSLTFGPNGSTHDKWLNYGELGEYSPAIVASTAWLISRDEDFVRVKPGDEVEISTDIFGQTTTPAEEARIEWLDVSSGSKTPVRLALGSMGPPLAVMRKCTDELMTHWGVDLEAHRHLDRSVVPQDPARWIRSADYPPDLVRSGTEGLVQFRLSVSEEGKPTQCHIQQSTRPESFDKAVCDLLMKRARFEPALDRNGEPIASFYRSSVRFEMP